MYDMIKNPKKFQEVNNKLEPIFDDLIENNISVDAIRLKNKTIAPRDKDGNIYTRFLLLLHIGSFTIKKRQSFAFHYGLNLFKEYTPHELKEVTLYNFSDYFPEKEEIIKNDSKIEQMPCISKDKMTMEEKADLNKILTILDSSVKKYNTTKEELMYFLTISAIKRNANFFLEHGYLKNDCLFSNQAFNMYMMGFHICGVENEVENISPKSIKTL